MVRKRKLIIVAVIIAFVTFLTTTNYLLKILIDEESVLVLTPPDQIYEQLRDLPEIYKIRKPVDSLVYNYIENLNSKETPLQLNQLWLESNSWLSKRGIVDFSNKNLGAVFQALKQTQIIKADIDTRGTQLKLLLTLKGNQEVIFKPKWYSIDKVIEGPVYAGKDRYFSEIIAFYLSLILSKPFTPISAYRTISLREEIFPKATKRLLNTTFERNNKTCIYGKCFYCKRDDPICENNNSTTEGVVIFNMNALFSNYRSPWQRTYKKGKKSTWEENENYCVKFVKKKLPKRRILDLIDTAIFDFLIQNGDRHHYETLHDNIILLDNGKGFGNPNLNHVDILAPLYQCCMLRNTTWKKLLSLSGGRLSEYLTKMPDLVDLLTQNHLKAIEERLLLIFATVEYCRSRNRIKNKIL